MEEEEKNRQNIVGMVREVNLLSNNKQKKDKKFIDLKQEDKSFFKLFKFILGKEELYDVRVKIIPKFQVFVTTKSNVSTSVLE